MIYVIGIGIYFLGMLIIGYMVKNRIKSTEDYLVAGRSFNSLFNTATLAACFIGGTVVIAIPGMVYSTGIWNNDEMWGAAAEVLGCPLCLLVCGLFYMPKIWKLRLLSMGDLYYNRFGRTTGMVASCLLAFTLVFWISAQVLVFAKVASAMMDWNLTASVLIAISVICAYTVMGGLWAVCLTDLIQIGIVLIGLLVLTPVMISEVGGLSAFIDQVPTEKVRFWPEVPPLRVGMAWTAALVIIGLGSVTAPDIMQRAFSASSVSVIRRSTFWAAILVMTTTFLAICLSLGGGMLVDAGAVPSELIEEDPEMILPVLFKAILPSGLVVLFMSACLAAVMSAAASSLIALGGMLSKNVVKDVFAPQMSDKNLMLASRILVVLTSILAAYIALALPSAFTLGVFSSDLVFSCLFGTMTMGLFWKKTNRWGAIAGMLMGILIRVGVCGMQYGFSMESLAFTGEDWYLYTLGAPVACILTIVAVSLATQKIDPPIEVKEYSSVTEHQAF